MGSDGLRTPGRLVHIYTYTLDAIAFTYHITKYYPFLIT